MTSTTQPRWLSEEDQKTWRTYLRATQEVQTKLDKDLATYGLSLNEYEVMVVLSEQPDHHRPSGQNPPALQTVHAHQGEVPRVRRLGGQDVPVGAVQPLEQHFDGAVW